jgi:hypothetical protein
MMAPAARIARASALALALAFASTAGGGVAAAAPPDDTSVAGSPLPGARTAPRPSTPDEAASYAEREKKASPELSRFAGGDVIVITTTTLAIVLIIVLLVILL